jgi:hypothetical protein
MKRVRLAFTAERWGSGAVVCRAIENRPGLAVQQEFGEFPTWSEAQVFADKLNEGLELTWEEARQIVIGAGLAVRRGTFVARKKKSVWSLAPVLVEAERLCWQNIHAQMELASTYCHILKYRQHEPAAHRMEKQIRFTIKQATDQLLRSKRRRRELQQAFLKLQTLKSLAQQILI